MRPFFYIFLLCLCLYSFANADEAASAPAVATMTGNWPRYCQIIKRDLSDEIALHVFDDTVFSDLPNDKSLKSEFWTLQIDGISFPVPVADYKFRTHPTSPSGITELDLIESNEAAVFLNVWPLSKVDPKENFLKHHSNIPREEAEKIWNDIYLRYQVPVRTFGSQLEQYKYKLGDVKCESTSVSVHSLLAMMAKKETQRISSYRSSEDLAVYHLTGRQEAILRIERALPKRAESNKRWIATLITQSASSLIEVHYFSKSKSDFINGLGKLWAAFGNESHKPPAALTEKIDEFKKQISKE